MKSNVLVWFSLAMVMSVVGFGNLSRSSSSCVGLPTANAASVYFFFAEESSGTPTKKTDWEWNEEGSTTLNLWATTDFNKGANKEIHLDVILSYDYVNGISVGDLSIGPVAATSVDWCKQFNPGANAWHIYSSSQTMSNWYGFGRTENALDSGTYYVGSINLSVVDGVTLPDGATFSIALDTTRSAGIYDGSYYFIPSIATTTVTKKPEEVPEPGTWAMLAGLGLVGGTWYRRRCK